MALLLLLQVVRSCKRSCDEVLLKNVLLLRMVWRMVTRGGRHLTRMPTSCIQDQPMKSSNKRALPPLSWPRILDPTQKLSNLKSRRIECHVRRPKKLCHVSRQKRCNNVTKPVLQGLWSVEGGMIGHAASVPSSVGA